MHIPYELILEVLDSDINKCFDCQDRDKINDILKKYGYSYMTKFEDTMLIFACRNGDHKMVQDLLNLGADPNYEGPLITPLFEAVRNNQSDIVDLLINNGVNINKTSMYSMGQNVLHIACRNNNYQIVYRLCKKGININKLTVEHNTPLHIAAEDADSKIIDCLVENGAKLDIKNDKGETALFLAARYGNVENAQKLIRYGCDLHIKNDKGISPLMCMNGWVVTTTTTILPK